MRTRNLYTALMENGILRYTVNFRMRYALFRQLKLTQPVSFVPTSSDQFFIMATVTNKEICLVRIVFILCKVLCHLFAGLLIEKKKTFFLAIEFAVSTSLLRHNRITTL